MVDQSDNNVRVCGDVGAEETHLSMLFFTPDRVFKMLKPVDLGFVSFVDRGDRLAATSKEFDRNRRLSPDVYLGTSDVVEDGELRERLLVMRRLPEEVQLDRLVDEPDFAARLRDVARHIATLHAGLASVTGDAAVGATRDRLRANWDDNLAVLDRLSEPDSGLGPVVSADEVDEVRSLATAYLDGRAPLFAARIDDGRIVEGHGDLRAEHVFCTEAGPRLIDCLAFRDDYRTVDVLNDVAFLAMDLHRLSGPQAAAGFIRDYDEFAAEHHPSTLAHHFVAYRAHVRAKVAAIRLAQGDRAAAADVASYHRLALEHLRVGQVRLVLVGGGAGVGKSTVAERLADRLGAVRLRTDEVRKGLAEVAVDRHLFEEPGAGAYGPEFSDRVHDELLRQAEVLLERGESVVLDATWSSAAHRESARGLAARTTSSLTELRCVAPLAVAKERIARRMASLHEPSDATPEIAEHIAARFDDWPESEPIDTAGPIPASIEAACRATLARPGDPSDGSQDPTPTPLSYDSVRFYLSRRLIIRSAEPSS